MIPAVPKCAEVTDLHVAQMIGSSRRASKEPNTYRADRPLASPALYPAAYPSASPDTYPAA